MNLLIRCFWNNCVYVLVFALNVKLSSTQFQIHSTDTVNAEQIILVFNSAGPLCHSREIIVFCNICFWIQETFPADLGLWSPFALLCIFRVLNKPFFFLCEWKTSLGDSMRCIDSSCIDVSTLDPCSQLHLGSSFLRLRLG